MAIPDELKQFRQWIVWKMTVTPDGRTTKIPYSPNTGYLASVIDPNAWSDYATAERVVSLAPFNGLGFVLTDDDPFTFIDLDDTKGDPLLVDLQQKIAYSFDTYGEISPSGRGLHLIVRGKVPDGRKRKSIEIYSSKRYMTVTGNTFPVFDKPIAERQQLLELLWCELANNKSSSTEIIEVLDQPEIYSDDIIYNMALGAENGEKFYALWGGQWHEHYKSQSEADYALINMLGFYSRNAQQIHRLFLRSALGQRDKAKRKAYVMHMIRNSFDNMPPQVNLTAVVDKIEQQIKDHQEQPQDVNPNPFAGPLFANLPDQEYEWTLPPGLMGDIANYIYQSSPKPIREVALAASIGLMAGICGRSYNISGTGLNQYVLILARTGIGKEAASKGIDHLINACLSQVPAIDQVIGPGDIASGQALSKYLPTHPCFVSIVGEFGLVLKQICSVHASGAEVRLRKMLLMLYNKSGAGQVLRPTIYSDKAESTLAINSPAFSLLGESTLDTFYGSMDDTMIKQGLFPRFTIIEYNGLRPPTNREHLNIKPNADLISKLSNLAACCFAMTRENVCIPVQLDVEASDMEKAFDIKCDRIINATDTEIVRELWTRAHIKSLKLAALLAVGINMYEPMINAQCMKWSVDLVERDIEGIMRKFDSGKIGIATNEVAQIEEVKVLISEFLMRPYSGAMKQASITEDMHKQRVLTHGYMQKKLLNKPQFRGDRIGGINALNRAIQTFITDGAITKLGAMQAWNAYRKNAVCYCVMDAIRFLPSPSISAGPE